MKRHIRAIRPVMVSLLWLAACLPAPSSGIAKSGLARDTERSMPVAEMQSLTRLNNSFGTDLYQTLRTDQENFVFSPYSISAAVAMTYAGARTATESQMASALHFELPQTQLHPGFNQLDLALLATGSPDRAGDKALQLRITNAVWAEQTLPLMDEYLDVVARNYGAGVRLADFLMAHESARREINSWVAGQTEQRIKDLIPEGALDSSTRMVLVNAIYFLGDWLHKFDADHTSDAAFFLLDGSEITVRMMRNDMGSIPYAAGPGYAAVELPYQGGTAAMDIIVPDAGTFEAFDASLTSQVLEAILGALHPTALHLELPRFRYATAFDLEPQLAALGMTDAFDPDLADFSGMSGGRDLFISRALHQAFVAVDEEGTEAAAATAIIMGPTSAMLPDQSLTVNRPFIFVIRDLGTGQILFMGRVLAPSQ